MPQRHRLPHRPCSASSRVGLGFSSSRPFAAMTNPGVQYPHCCASLFQNAAETGCRLLPVARPLDGFDLAPLRVNGQHAATVDRLAVHNDGAGAARAPVADALGPGQVQVIAHCVEQGHARFNVDVYGFAVDVEGDRDSAWGRSHGPVRRLLPVPAAPTPGRRSRFPTPRMNPRREKPPLGLSGSSGFFLELTKHLPFVHESSW